jgi:hypothetical protein
MPSQRRRWRGRLRDLAKRTLQSLPLAQRSRHRTQFDRP